MGNAIWLFLALPKWYFTTILDPFGAGMLTAVPAVGVLCLALGLVLAIFHRSPRLWLFELPFLASEGFVVFAGWQRGQIPSAGWLLLAFLGAQLALAVGLVAYAKRALMPAIAFALFSMSYALFASFVAGMSLADNWL